MHIRNNFWRAGLTAGLIAAAASGCVDAGARDQAAAASAAARQAEETAAQARAAQTQSAHDAQVAAAEARAANERANLYEDLYYTAPPVIVTPNGKYVYEETIITRHR